MTYISVRNWRRFQHYDPAKRQPPWIKIYTELGADDEWINLSGHDRSVLVCIWLEYASSRCRLRADTRTLTRQLNLKVTTSTLERLNHAGYIDIVASKTLAEGYQGASTSRARVETEKEEEQEQTRRTETVTVSSRAPRAPDGRDETNGAGHGYGTGMNLIGNTIKEQLAALTPPDEDEAF